MQKYNFCFRSTHADYLNPDSLNGSITIRLFDERSKEAKYAVFLGSIEVPISAICNSQVNANLSTLKALFMLSFLDGRFLQNKNSTFTHRLRPI